MLKTQALISFYQEHHQIIQNQTNKPFQSGCGILTLLIQLSSRLGLVCDTVIAHLARKDFIFKNLVSSVTFFRFIRYISVRR